MRACRQQHACACRFRVEIHFHRSWGLGSGKSEIHRIRKESSAPGPPNHCVTATGRSNRQVHAGAHHGAISATTTPSVTATGRCIGSAHNGAEGRTGHVTGNQEAIMRQPEVINDPLNLGRASTARSTRPGATAAHVAAPMGASKTVETSRARSPLVQRGLGFVRALLHAHQLRVDGMSLGEHEPAAIRRNHVRASLSIAPRSLTS